MLCLHADDVGNLDVNAACGQFVSKALCNWAAQLLGRDPRSRYTADQAFDSLLKIEGSSMPIAGLRVALVKVCCR